MAIKKAGSVYHTAGLFLRVRPAHSPSGAGRRRRRRRYNRLVTLGLEQQIINVCGAQPGVVAVYLFGSVARGTDRPSSDVDVAVLFEKTPEARLDGPRLTLEGDLERALGRRVDLVVLNDAPADLRIRVMRDQHLLLDRDRSSRIRFEVQTRNEAFDLAPILAAYRSPRTRQS